MKIRALIAIFLSVASIFIVSCDRPNQPEEPVVNEFEGVRVDFSYDLYHSTIHAQMEHGDYLDFVKENKETLLPIKWISYDEIRPLGEFHETKFFIPKEIQDDPKKAIVYKYTWNEPEMYYNFSLWISHAPVDNPYGSNPNAYVLSDSEINPNHMDELAGKHEKAVYVYQDYTFFYDNNELSVIRWVKDGETFILVFESYNWPPASISEDHYISEFLNLETIEAAVEKLIMSK